MKANQTSDRIVRMVASCFSYAAGAGLLCSPMMAQGFRTATATATVVNGFVVAVTVTDGGGGYVVAPGVAFEGGGGDGARAEATVHDGSVDKITVTDAGSGYASAPQVIISPPPPAEAPFLESVKLASVLTIRAQKGTTNWILGADVLYPNKWRVLTNVVVANSPYLFVDTEATPGQRYYRALAAPEAPVLPTDPPGMVWIMPGTFTMVSGDSDRTVVTLSRGFWIGEHEVTQEEYLTVMGRNPAGFKGNPKLPVEMVSWFDARDYCVTLTERERVTGQLPPGYEYRLPTEAQWEYACRAGTSTATAYGDSLSSTQANFDGNYPVGGAAKGPILNQTAPVKSYLPNAWGLFDMHGNVSEWCADWLGGAYPGGSVTDPKGPASGTRRVVRGGAWKNMGWYCLSRMRDSTFPTLSYNTVGFRVVLVPVP